ncbi:hypothetical protein CANINC_004646 [Pichia inconspicua]|uniref:Histone transcription regulator 3 homolog n=1 Tax=Pichia inconspicua TaxID=52247 RepID=A0A4T0WVZ9_9ASCO|nr:hypothetical protein CANINC_004646 [[Candida] inconspicua]
MSSFTARNLSDDDSDIQEHTRELQIELALNILNKALNSQKIKDYSSARSYYNELGNLEIVKSNSISNNPIIDRLKYLHSRNSGFLRIHKLVESKNINDPSIVVSKYNEIIDAINDLLNAINYSPPDEKTILLLGALFTHFGHTRLARLCYELKLPSNRLLLNDCKITNSYLQLLESLHLNRTKIQNSLAKSLHHSSFKNLLNSKINWNDILTPDEWKLEQSPENFTINIDVDIVANTIQLQSFWESFANALPKPRGKNKYPDAYIFTDDPIHDIHINFNEQIEHDLTSIDQDEHENFVDALDYLHDPPTTPITPITTTTTTTTTPIRPIRNLRGKNDILENVDALQDEIKNLDSFISSILPQFLSNFNISLNFQQLADPLINDNPQLITDPIERLFYTILTKWDDDATQSLHIIDNIENNRINSINELLNIQQTKLVLSAKFTPVPYNDLSDLLKRLSDSKIHFHLLRTHLFEFFTSPHKSYSFNSIITTVKVDKNSLKTFKNLVDSVSISYYKRIQNNILYNSSSPEDLNIAISILESLLDSYLEFINDQKLKKSSKTTSELTFFENTTGKQINLWLDLIENYFTNQPSSDLENYLWIKYKWLQINYIQTNPEQINSQTLISWLFKMKQLSTGKDIYQPFINYEFIPVLDLEAIENQHSKLKILEIFNNNEKSNEILESILLNTETEYANDEIKLQLTSFLENSNLQMKLRLWSLLLRYYRVNKNFTNYKKSFEKIIGILISQLYESTDDSKTRLLNVIGFFTFFTKQFIDLFCESSETAKQLEFHDLKISKTMVKSAASLLHLFYITLIYNKITSIESRPNKLSNSKKSNELIEDAISSCFFLISSYISNVESSNKPELINDLLSMCHVHLGLRNRCNSLNGNFLFFLQCKLSKLDFNISANDVFQIIHCRFGFPVTIDKFETFDHKCKPVKLDLPNAIQLSNYISTYCFRGKHPVQSPPKSDIKNIIDSIIEVVGNVGMENLDVIKNRKLFDAYLNETKIDLSFILRVFCGDFSLEFTKPNFHGIEVAQNGLFYLQGLVGINFFKVRKKTVQNRVSELEPACKILKRDLYCGTNRFETWVSLGQIYSYVVEDDLIWTADKLNSLEKKQVTALSQKNSLLCYLMAISIYVRASDEQKEAYKPVLNSLWDSFSKELYNAWMHPMNKKAFHTFQITKTSDNKKSKLIESVSNDIPAAAILKLLELGFQNAIKYDEKNWYDYMYLAKSKYKLCNETGYKLPPEEILNLMTKACCLAYDQSSKEDPIIEPHYYIISMIIKLWVKGDISAQDGTDFLIKDPLFEDVGELYLPSKDFVDKILVVLDKLINYDKKNWQHRPVFRRAKILEEMKNNTSAAKDEMLKLVNLKPTVRSLSSIWKPLYERPGKHFIYNAIYTKFLTAVLYKMGDLHSLIVLLKKIRRAGVVMVNLTKIFDDMTLRICTLIKKSIKLNNGYLEDMLTRVNYKDFLKYSSKFIEFMKQKSDFDRDTLLDLFFLSEMQIFRKLATGFGATSLIDEVFHSLYMKLFVQFLFKSLVNDRNGGFKLSQLLHKAKEFKLEKVLSEHKSRTATPDLSHLSTAEKTNSVTPMEVDVWDVDSELSDTDKNNIIAYLSFKEVIPTKDKIKLARRDISPFAIKLILATTKPVDKLREDTNDGETISYNIPPILNDSELTEIASQLNSKETKENKEEKEFDKLIAEHERLFNDDELSKFNTILQKFGIAELVKLRPPPARFNDNSTKSENYAPNMPDRAMHETAEPTTAEPTTVESSSVENVDGEFELHAKVVAQQVQSNETAIELALQSVVESISQPPISSLSTTKNQQTYPEEASVDVSAEETFKKLTECAVADDSHETSANETEESIQLKNMSSGSSEMQESNPSVPDAVVNVLQTAKSNSPDIAESPQDIKVSQTSTDTKSKEPSPKKQSDITSFFKISPEKTASVIKREGDNTRVDGSPESKRRRLIDPEEDFNRYQKSLDSLSADHPLNKTSLSSESIPSRRNSKRQLLTADLFELGKNGNPRPQRKKNKPSDIVEVSSDSDSVIIID